MSTSIWMRPNDFDHLSYGGVAKCSVCGSTKRDHEDSVFRPPHPDDFSGFFDICEGCIREAAKTLGLAETAGAERVIEKLQREVSDLSADLSGARDAQAALARENVRLQDVMDDLNAPFEIPSDDMEMYDGPSDG